MEKEKAARYQRTGRVEEAAGCIGNRSGGLDIENRASTLGWIGRA